MSLLPFGGARAAEKRLALLIGNQSYERSIGALSNPVNDVNIIKKSLEKIGFEVMPPVIDGSRIEILSKLHEFATRLNDETAQSHEVVGFVYYSGHGFAIDGENYIIPVDIKDPSRKILSIQGVTQSKILSTLTENAPNALHYLVLDACRNNIKGFKGGGKGFVPFREKRNGVLIAYATEPGTTASDVGNDSGPYAAALARELLRPGQDDLNMFHKVRVAVEQSTDGEQIPWTEDGVLAPERIYFGGRHGGVDQDEIDEAIALLSEFDFMDLSSDASTNVLLVSALKRFQKELGWLQNGNLSKSILKELRNLKVQRDAARDENKIAENKYNSGDTFRDCDSCPSMVIIPPGRFKMGSEGGFDDEMPVRDIEIPSYFAVGRYEITIGEWNACVAAQACKHKPSALGTGDDYPVTGVSWLDVREYTSWLSSLTRKKYRLLTEEEWEYVARSGASSRYAFGNRLTGKQARFSQDTWGDAKGPVRRGSYGSNKFGVYDMHGNVWEWTQNCWRDSHAKDLSASTYTDAHDCGRRVLRGGSWANLPVALRVTTRSANGIGSRFDYNGFRVAISLGD